MNDAVLVCIREMSAALARIRERRAAPTRDAAHHSLSHAYIFSVSWQNNGLAPSTAENRLCIFIPFERRGQQWLTSE